MIIDGNDLIVGRASTVIAKRLMMGEKVDVINCEEMVITGSKKNVFAKYTRIKTMGVPSKGPFQPRRPDMFVKRIIRGMVPYKQPKGRDAFKRVKCYIGKGVEGESKTIEVASIDKVPNLKYVKIKDICKELGWQK
jgi:large subunit ribosomal protein L13